VVTTAISLLSTENKNKTLPKFKTALSALTKSTRYLVTFSVYDKYTFRLNSTGFVVMK